MGLRRLDTSPNPIASIRYQFCRSDNKCASHAITRPPAPVTPGVTPTPVPDVNNTVHPGVPEVPGNGIDEPAACAGRTGRFEGGCAVQRAALPVPAWLATGITLDIVVSAPNTIAKVSRYVIRRRKIPAQRSLCLPLGATQPQTSC